MCNDFVGRVGADSEEAINRLNRHRTLLDENTQWQRQAEALAGRHEQRIEELEANVNNQERYINSLEVTIASLESRMDFLEEQIETRRCKCGKSTSSSVLETRGEPMHEDEEEEL